MVNSYPHALGELRDHDIPEKPVGLLGVGLQKLKLLVHILVAFQWNDEWLRFRPLTSRLWKRISAATSAMAFSCAW